MDLLGGQSFHFSLVLKEITVNRVLLLFGSAKGSLVELLQCWGDMLLTALKNANQVETMLLLFVVAFGVEESNGLTLGSGAAGTTAAMDVIFDGKRESVVDNELNALDVKTTTGNVGGDEGSDQVELVVVN